MTDLSQMPAADIDPASLDAAESATLENEGALARAFDPQAVEPGWAERWRTEPFRADATSGREPFTIVISKVMLRPCCRV